MRIQISLPAKKYIDRYSLIGRTAVCGIVYPCSIQGTYLINHDVYIIKKSKE